MVRVERVVGSLVRSGPVRSVRPMVTSSSTAVAAAVSSSSSA
jgi:hypothetical protein